MICVDEYSNSAVLSLVATSSAGIMSFFVPMYSTNKRSHVRSGLTEWPFAGPITTWMNSVTGSRCQAIHSNANVITLTRFTQPDRRRKQQEPTRKPDLADWFYIPAWKGTPSATLLAEPKFSTSSAPWLLFVDDLGLGERIASDLGAQGQQAIIVRQGENFAQADTQSYWIEPQNRDHYIDLFKDLRKAGREPSRVLHLWNVNTETTTEALGQIDEMEGQAFYSLLYLGQALAEQTIGTRVVVVVSNHMQDVFGDGSGSPSKSLLIGPYRLITKECAQVDRRSVDLELDNAAQISNLLVRQLIADWRRVRAVFWWLIAVGSAGWRVSIRPASRSRWRAVTRARPCCAKMRLI